MKATKDIASCVVQEMHSNKLLQSGGGRLEKLDNITQMLPPTDALLVSSLKSSRHLHEVKRIHAAAAQCGTATGPYVGNALISAYAKVGSLTEAARMFERMRLRTLAAYTTLMLGYAAYGQGLRALELFRRMPLAPDAHCFVAAVKACNSCSRMAMDKSLAIARELHSSAAVSGVTVQSVHLGNALISLYCKCGCMERARRVFSEMMAPNVVSYNSLILGCAENGENGEAIRLYHAMQKLGSLAPDARTFVAVLKACCGSLGLLRSSGDGVCLEAEQHGCGASTSMYVMSSVLGLYAKSGRTWQARRVLERVPAASRGLVAWNAMLFGYAENGQSVEAVELFWEMKQQGMRPDELTLVAVLKACSCRAMLEVGRAVHREADALLSNSDRSDPSRLIACALVALYSKCGAMQDAEAVFRGLGGPQRSCVTWTALMSGYAVKGEATRVAQLWKRMSDAGSKPDGVSLLCLLNAYKHSGMVEHAHRLLSAMPAGQCELQHYACVADALARSGRVEDALALVTGMPFQADVVVWRSLLAASCRWGNAEVANVAFKQLLRLDATDTTAYLLMANINRMLS